MLTQEQLHQIHATQIQIMDAVHALCEKQNITYYMIAGSVLGAVRHGGFIPWDLDIDIAMLRPDYERFIQLCETQLDEQLCCLHWENNAKHSRPHAVICKKGTVLTLKYDCFNRHADNFGIYIDVFPLDNAPDEEKLRKKHAKQLLSLRKLKERRVPYSYSCDVWRRAVHYTVSFLLSWLPIKTINRYQQQLMQKYRDQQTSCICSMASQYAYEKQCMPRSIYGKPVLLEFEGRRYYAPEKYEAYLTRLYGDYMQLPPEEKRQANLEVYAEVEIL